jgi:hypothetical protein
MAWIVKVFDVVIVIPLLAGVERLFGTPMRRRHGKIGNAVRFCQCTFMRICRQSRKTLPEKSRPTKS